jgi:hypothetical protein
VAGRLALAVSPDASVKVKSKKPQMQISLKKVNGEDNQAKIILKGKTRMKRIGFVLILVCLLCSACASSSTASKTLGTQEEWFIALNETNRASKDVMKSNLWLHQGLSCNEARAFREEGWNRFDNCLSFCPGACMGPPNYGEFLFLLILNGEGSVIGVDVTINQLKSVSDTHVMEYYEFFKTVCVNKGIDQKVIDWFDSIAENPNKKLSYTYDEAFNNLQTTFRADRSLDILILRLNILVIVEE